MKIIITLCLGSAFFLIGCNNNKETEVTVPKDETGAYFPVADIISAEVNRIDSLPVGIMKKVIRDGKTDSGFIERAEFRELVAPFTNPNLSSGSLKENYTESSFDDASTGYVTFTYSPINQQAITRIDVMAKASGNSHKVQNIYMEANYSKQDTAILEKMMWKTSTSLQIIRQKKAGNTDLLEQILLIWDPSSY